MSELVPTSRLFAERLDREDPLASFRDEFVIVDDSLCYLADFAGAHNNVLLLLLP